MKREEQRYVKRGDRLQERFSFKKYLSSNKTFLLAKNVP